MDLPDKSNPLGIQAGSVNQLFSTPPELAKRIVGLAGIMPGQKILDPTVGTGNLLFAAFRTAGGCDVAQFTAIEISPVIFSQLQRAVRRWLYSDNVKIICGDFLEKNGELGTFDRIIMDPPFENAVDIQYIQHARRFLKPGGRLVAVCGNGPKQQEQLKPEADEWIDLEPDVFDSSSMMVKKSIVVFLALSTANQWL